MLLLLATLSLAITPLSTKNILYADLLIVVDLAGDDEEGYKTTLEMKKLIEKITSDNLNHFRTGIIACGLYRKSRSAIWENWPINVLNAFNETLADTLTKRLEDDFLKYLTRKDLANKAKHEKTYINELNRLQEQSILEDYHAINDHAQSCFNFAIDKVMDEKCKGNHANCLIAIISDGKRTDNFANKATNAFKQDYLNIWFPKRVRDSKVSDVNLFKYSNKPVIMIYIHPETHSTADPKYVEELQKAFLPNKYTYLNKTSTRAKRDTTHFTTILELYNQIVQYGQTDFQNCLPSTTKVCKDKGSNNQSVPCAFYFESKPSNEGHPYGTPCSYDDTQQDKCNTTTTATDDCAKCTTNCCHQWGDWTSTCDPCGTTKTRIAQWYGSCNSPVEKQAYYTKGTTPNENDNETSCNKPCTTPTTTTSTGTVSPLASPETVGTNTSSQTTPPSSSTTDDGEGKGDTGISIEIKWGAAVGTAFVFILILALIIIATLRYKRKNQKVTTAKSTTGSQRPDGFATTIVSTHRFPRSVQQSRSSSAMTGTQSQRSRKSSRKTGTGTSSSSSSSSSSSDTTQSSMSKTLTGLIRPMQSFSDASIAANRKSQGRSQDIRKRHKRKKKDKTKRSHRDKSRGADGGRLSQGGLSQSSILLKDKPPSSRAPKTDKTASDTSLKSERRKKTKKHKKKKDGSSSPSSRESLGFTSSIRNMTPSSIILGAKQRPPERKKKKKKKRSKDRSDSSQDKDKKKKEKKGSISVTKSAGSLQKDKSSKEKKRDNSKESEEKGSLSIAGSIRNMIQSRSRSKLATRTGGDKAKNEFAKDGTKEKPSKKKSDSSSSSSQRKKKKKHKKRDKNKEELSKSASRGSILKPAISTKVVKFAPEEKEVEKKKKKKKKKKHHHKDDDKSKSGDRKKHKSKKKKKKKKKSDEQSESMSTRPQGSILNIAASLRKLGKGSSDKSKGKKQDKPSSTGDKKPTLDDHLKRGSIIDLKNALAKQIGHASEKSIKTQSSSNGRDREYDTNS